MKFQNVYALFTILTFHIGSSSQAGKDNEASTSSFIEKTAITHWMGSNVGDVKLKIKAPLLNMKTSVEPNEVMTVQNNGAGKFVCHKFKNGRLVESFPSTANHEDPSLFGVTENIAQMDINKLGTHVFSKSSSSGSVKSNTKATVMNTPRNFIMRRKRSTKSSRNRDSEKDKKKVESVD